MSGKGKNIVLLSDEQLGAFKVLFPNISVASHNTDAKKNRRKLSPKKTLFREQIEALFKQKFPFS